MSQIEIEELIKRMIEAASAVLKNKWPETKRYAENEFKKFCENIKYIQELKESGEITEERAKKHVEIQKEAMQSVLLTIEGLGKLAVEQVINAAIGVIRDIVNNAIGWKIL